MFTSLFQTLGDNSKVLSVQNFGSFITGEVFFLSFLFLFSA